MSPRDPVSHRDPSVSRTPRDPVSHPLRGDTVEHTPREAASVSRWAGVAPTCLADRLALSAWALIAFGTVLLLTVQGVSR